MSLSSTFANNEERINSKVANSFKKEFSQASDVKWHTGKDYVKATFKMNDQVMYAYYNAEGTLLGVTRNLTTSQLPINLLSDVKKNYSATWVTDLFEMANTDETSYYITLEDADQTIVLKSVGSNGWNVYKKERKEK
jgi:hypothetical protein